MAKTGWQLPTTGTFTQSLGTGAPVFAAAAKAGSGGGISGGSADGRPVLGVGENAPSRSGTSPIKGQTVGGVSGGTVGGVSGRTYGGVSGQGGPVQNPEKRNKPNSANYVGQTFQEFQFVDNLLNDYQSLQESIAAANRLGIETPAAANRLANLENQLANSRLDLQDKLGGLDRQGLQAFADQVNANYGNDTAAIQRTKEFLLHDLKLRNEGRTAQTEYLRTIFGDIENQLQQVRDQTNIKRREGKRVRTFNREGLLGNASARGATRSAGLMDAQLEEEAKLSQLLTEMNEADQSAEQKAGADRRATQREIDKLVEAQKQDILGVRQNLGDLDTKKGGLDIDRKKNYADYLIGIARLNAEAEQRNKERMFGEALRRAAENQRQQAYNAAIAQANAAAQTEAWNRAVMMNAMREQSQFNQWQASGGQPTNEMWGNWIRAGGTVPAWAPANIRRIAGRQAAPKGVYRPSMLFGR